MREETGTACPGFDALVRASSGELLPGEVRRVRAHIETCATCREQIRQIESITWGVRAERDADSSRRRRDPATRETSFSRGLHERKQARIHHPSRSPFARRLTAAAILALVVGTFLFSRTHTAVLRADALLQRAVAESHAQPAGVDRVQRVRIQLKPANARAAATWRRAALTSGPDLTQADAVTVVREVVNGLAIAPGTEPPSASVAPPAALAHVLDLQPVDWQHPLGIERLQTWRLALTDKHDQITNIGPDLVMLRTTTMQGVLREVTLVMRRDSYRVIRQSLLFDGLGLVEIEEIAQSTRPALPAASRPATTVANSETAAPVAVDGDEMERAEIEARFVLRDAELDLGEVHVARVRELVRVDGAVASASQRRAVGTRLAALPHVRVGLRARDAASAPAANEFSTDASPVSASAAWAPGAARPDLRGWISRNFEEGSPAGAAFVPELTRLAATMSQRLRALQELGQRYPESQIPRLAPDVRARLQELVNRHYAAINRDLDALDGRMAVLFGSTSRCLPLTQAPSDWTHRAAAGLAQAQALDHLVQELLTHVDVPEDMRRRSGAESLAHTFGALWDAVNAAPVPAS
jgi:hypothetical protein